MKLFLFLFITVVIGILGYFVYLIIKALSDLVDTVKKDDTVDLFNKEMKECENLILEKIKGDLARKRIFAELDILKNEIKNKSKREHILIQIRKIVEELKAVKVEMNDVDASTEEILKTISVIKGA